MLEKLIDVILSFIDDIKPWVVVPVYDECLILRFGRSHRLLVPGIYFKIPFVDQPNPVTVVTTTIGIPVQMVITKDGKSVATKSIVKYKINDTRKHIESIYGAKEAIIDFTQAKTMLIINSRTFEECRDTEDLSNILGIKVRAEVKKYGIEVEQATLTDLVEAPSYRLFTDGGAIDAV